MIEENQIKAPPVRQQSHAKILIRTVVLAVFTTIFGIALYRDIKAGLFHPMGALIIFIICLAIGFQMSKLVPMQIYADLQVITLSFDKIYFILIWCLVILKVIASRVLGFNLLADVIMSSILGLMMGRLSGICLRVRTLKNDFC